MAYAELPRRAPSPDVNLVTIQPEHALKFLDQNIDNRNVRQAIVDRYAADMEAGNWHVGTSAIVIAVDGRVLDGQHRLLACVQAEVPFTTILVTGVDPAARDGIDTGLKRTLGDALTWHGEPGATKDLAAGIRASWLWANYPDNPFGIHARALSFDEAVAWLHRNPSLRQARTTALHVTKQLRMPRSIITAVVHRIRLIDPDAADELIEQVTEGVGLEKGDPALALRRWVTTMLADGRRMDIAYLHCAWIQAWNAHVAGRQLQIVRWKRSDRCPHLADHRGLEVPFTDEIGLVG